VNEEEFARIFKEFEKSVKEFEKSVKELGEMLFLTLVRIA
jgi:hypothetical protein